MLSPSSSGKDPAQLCVVDPEQERMVAELLGFVTHRVLCRPPGLRVRSARRPSSSLPVPRGYLSSRAKFQGISYNGVISRADRRGVSVCHTPAVNRPPQPHACHPQKGSVLTGCQWAGKLLPVHWWSGKARRQGTAKTTQNKQTRAQEMAERCWKAAEPQLCRTFGLHGRA